MSKHDFLFWNGGSIYQQVSFFLSLSLSWDPKWPNHLSHQMWIEGRTPLPHPTWWVPRLTTWNFPAGPQIIWTQPARPARLPINSSVAAKNVCWRHPELHINLKKIVSFVLFFVSMESWESPPPPSRWWAVAGIQRGELKQWKHGNWNRSMSTRMWDWLPWLVTIRAWYWLPTWDTVLT